MKIFITYNFPINVFPSFKLNRDFKLKKNIEHLGCLKKSFGYVEQGWKKNLGLAPY